MKKKLIILVGLLLIVIILMIFTLLGMKKNEEKEYEFPKEEYIKSYMNAHCASEKISFLEKLPNKYGYTLNYNDCTRIEYGNYKQILLDNDMIYFTTKAGQDGFHGENVSLITSWEKDVNNDDLGTISVIIYKGVLDL